MLIRFSDKEAAILLGATLMHWGVPFRHAARRALNEQEQALVDQASDKLIELRERFQQEQSEPQEIVLSDQEATLLAHVVENCLHECGSDSTELSLQLKTDARGDVENLLDRLRATTAPVGG